jgi:hypothetical protein
MKGSVKIKFELGWTLSLLLSIVVIIGGVARTGFTYTTQERAQTICDVRTRIAVKGMGMSDSDRAVITEVCIAEEMKSNLEVFADINSWTYRSVYPHLSLPYNYEKVLAK